MLHLGYSLPLLSEPLNMARDKIHPAQQFEAPSAIQRGTPLKDLMSGPLISLIGRSLADVAPTFDLRQFETRAMDGLVPLDLKERASQIAHAMAEQLPDDFKLAVALVLKSFGPPLQATQGNGLAVFFYLPHSQWIAKYGIEDFESGMKANYEITLRFSAEFSVRPFLIRYQSQSLKLLKRWARDPNPHVRRLVSEGTRPRLPWAMRLPAFQQNPNLSLGLLELLKDDSELYVRRSVANHLGDIAKDHPDVVFDLCEQWLTESRQLDDPTVAENRRWIIRHALRYPAKKESPRALQIRTAATRSKKK